MAWIESHQELEKHPKTLLLAQKLNLSLDETIGKLHRFWWWCMNYAEDGNLSKYSEITLGNSIGYNNESDCKQFVSSMIECRLIDTEPCLRIHNWWEYAGRWLQGKYGKNAEKWKEIQSVYKQHTNCNQTVCHQFDVPDLPNLPNLPNLPDLKDKSIYVNPGGLTPVENASDSYKQFETIVLNAWNALTEKYPVLSKVVKISLTRRKHLKERFADQSFRKNIETAISLIPKSKFLLGENDREWTANFDWLIRNDTNYISIIEGKYNQREKKDHLL